MIKNISVLGAGTMGHGIAIVFAMHGYPVSIYESLEKVRTTVREKMKKELDFLVEEDYITREVACKTLENIEIYGELEPAIRDADYIIEALPEDLELKQQIFGRLDKICSAHTIFASNTSSLPLAGMIEHLSEQRKAKVMICHWYNPAYLIPIAELSCFGNMSDEDFDQVYALYEACEKQPVKVLKDVPGMVANRILHALAREVFSLMERRVASPEDIDKALKFGPGFRSATTGMLEVADMGGLDIWCTVEDSLFGELNNADHASDLMRQLVSQGHLGVKTGKGFFDYPEEERTKVVEAFNKRLVTQLKASKSYM